MAKLLAQKINASLYTIAGDNSTYLVHIWKWYGITYRYDSCASYITLIWVIAPHIKPIKYMVTALSQHNAVY